MLSVILAGVITLMIQYRDTDMFFLGYSVFFVFYGFYIKTSSMVFVCSCARKYMRTRSSVLLSLFRAQQGYTKKETPGVLFKLFSDSLNMKRLPSDLAIFTLDKVFEVSVW
jgi:hypothetical protein